MKTVFKFKYQKEIEIKYSAIEYQFTWEIEGFHKSTEYFKSIGDAVDAAINFVNFYRDDSNS